MAQDSFISLRLKELRGDVVDLLSDAVKMISEEDRKKIENMPRLAGMMKELRKDAYGNSNRSNEKN